MLGTYGAYRSFAHAFELLSLEARAAPESGCFKRAAELFRVFKKENPAAYARRLFIHSSESERLHSRFLPQVTNWTAHGVLEAEGIVYDPVLGVAEPLATYLEKSFERPRTLIIEPY
jgi:hypothetical protein